MLQSSNLARHTPMMQQYLHIKSSYPDIFLMYQMGDFFEFFFEDAEKAAPILEVALTQRGTSNGKPVKMAGVPSHALNQYLIKLVNAGHSVAICEQMDALSPNGKGLVKREVTRIVTPGTLTDSAFLTEQKENYLLSVFLDTNKKNIGLAWISLTQGYIYVTEVQEKQLKAEIARLAPSEILVAEDSTQDLKLSELYQGKITEIPQWHFELQTAHDLLVRHFKTKNLIGFGCENLSGAICAAGALLHFAQYTQKCLLSHISSLSVQSNQAHIQIDAQTRRNLELTETIRGQKSPTLFSILNAYASTAMGCRWIRQALHHPLRDMEQVNARYDVLEYLQQNTHTNSLKPLYSELQPILKQMSDIERICARIALRTVKPKELIQLKLSLEKLPQLRELLPSEEKQYPHLLCAAHQNFNGFEACHHFLESAIQQEPAAHLREGNVIADGFNAELDELRKISQNVGDYFVELENKEREKTRIPNLRIEYNRVHGYFIEVTRSFTHLVPSNYIRRQTLKNTERYTTSELKTFEDKILSAQSSILSLERQLFESVQNHLVNHIKELQGLGKHIAQLDGLAAWAQFSDEKSCVRAKLSTQRGISIQGGRHPVIEQKLPHFVPNDTDLDSLVTLLLITGPNMGGKSTYMRQTALIVLLAYCGCFVPAKSACIGPIDQIFTRIGSSDDLSSGHSTFMVEMMETSNILHNATHLSLILIDEIGRGTATFDGIALAFSILQYLIEKNQGMTLFSTHYFELTQLAQRYERIANVHLSAAEHEGKIAFLHTLQPGPASQSYGISVAQLAGIPEKVIQRARQHLQHLESKTPSLLADDIPQQQSLPLPTYQKTTQATADEQESRLKSLKEEVSAIHVDTLTPRKALDLLYELHEKIAAL